MSSPGRGLLRLVRGGVLAGCCATLSLTAHAAGGGSADLAPGVLLVALLLAAVCVAAADRRRGLGGIVAVVGVSQVVFHLLAGVGAHHAPAVGGGTAMVTAHVLVALAVSAALAGGERLLWSLFALLGVRRAVRLGRPLPPAHPRPALPVPVRPVSLRPAFPRSGAVWRGPPLLSN